MKFTNTLGKDYPIPNPLPASKLVPDWYKETESYYSGEKKPDGTGQTTATIKRCIPVFDAITSGYILLTPCDVYVSQKDGAPFYEWPSVEVISFHPVDQAPKHPGSTGFPYAKWLNPWAIKTPKGYSTLFVTPIHRDVPFNILEGLVDTDTYSSAVNFPFILKDPKFEGLIPAGTPMAQVIPVKRDSWKMEFGSDKDFMAQELTRIKLKTRFFDSYKNQFWSRKEYK